MKNEKRVERLDFPFVGNSWMLGRQDDDMLAEEMELVQKVGNRTYTVVVIYDITDNRKRAQVRKILEGYGEWVQRSAFECHISQRQYDELISKVLVHIDEDIDLLRIYKLTGNTEIKIWGEVPETFDEDLIII